jgi:putative lipoic acid-binding regulatory protein
MGEVTDESPLRFPCRFPIKMMGRESATFRRVVVDIVERHAGAIDAGDIAESSSRKGNFVSLTVTITATSRAQLDNIYRDLTASDDVLVAL